MSVTDASRRGREDVSSLSRYDVVLVGIPIPFLLALILTVTFDVSLELALGSAALVGVFALVDALFLNPPRQPPA